MQICNFMRRIFSGIMKTSIIASHETSLLTRVKRSFLISSRHGDSADADLGSGRGTATQGPRPPQWCLSSSNKPGSRRHHQEHVEHLPSVIGGNLTSVLSMNHCVLVVNLKLFMIKWKNLYLPSSLPLGTCTVLRSRECILEESELHWTDRVFCDGKVYLTLGPNDTWTPNVPQAMALKVLWDQEIDRTREERIRLQEGCFKLMRKLGLSIETSGT